MLHRIVEIFMPRVGELLVDHVHENIKDFTFTFDSLRRNLAELSAKASGIDNQIQNAEIVPGEKKRKREVEEWLAAVKSIDTEFSELENEVESQGFVSRFLGGGRAALLNERVDGLVQQSRHFDELLLQVCGTMGEASSAARLIGSTLEDNLERIQRLVCIEKVSSLGIHGMDGVGRTTLVKHINDQLLQQSEERVIWVTVCKAFTIRKLQDEKAFTIRKLQDEIARVVGVDLSDEENEDKRAARLWRALSGRKNILILDGLFYDINLKDVGYPLSEEGFRLIITTRSAEVCRRTSCKEVFVVKTLPKDEAWRLFSKTLGNETRLAPQVEEIAKCMAEMCGGSPLGIVVLAGSMRGETGVHVWRNALDELREYFVVGRDDMEDEVFKVLKYSFDRLNPNKRTRRQSRNVEQLCFLYGSLYPEDHEISKEELVGKFISEELLDCKERRRKQVDKGHCIVDKLLNVRLLESCAYGRVKMHDLVRSVALKITEGTTMVMAGYRSLSEIPNEEEWTKGLEKVSLMRNGIVQIPPKMSPNCPKLSTLLFCDNTLEFLPDSFFSQMLGLCTLDLSYTEIKKLPDSLFALERLKVLLLRCCKRLIYVPYLGNLKALRELDLSGTAIKELPQGIEELVHLELLCINVPKLVFLRSGLLLRFPNLQCLELPVVSDIEAPMGEIEKLKRVEVFRGRVGNMRDLYRFIRSRAHDAVFHINVGPASYKPKTLSIMTVGIWDDFGRLMGNPECRKTLEIEQCRGVECLLTPQELQYQVLPALENMFLYWLGDLKGIAVMEGREIAAPAPPFRQPPAFSSLKKMHIWGCHKMKKLGLPASEFPILEHLHVQDCKEIEEMFVEVGEEGEARSVSLPKLKELDLGCLPRLKSICNKATSVLANSIEEIHLSFCPSLKKFPLDVVPPPQSLRQINIIREEEWASMEWEDPSHPVSLNYFSLNIHFQFSTFIIGVTFTPSQSFIYAQMVSFPVYFPDSIEMIL